MRYLLFALFLTLIANAANLEITAKDFYHKDGEKKAIFSGNVVAKEGSNIIYADKIVIFLNDKNEAIKYEATGNVKFEIKDEKKNVKGSCNRLIYIPDKDLYKLYGNVALHDLLNKRDIYGDEVILDNKNKTSMAKSNGKKPVKFLFKVKDK